jgi:hypothetical protein
MLKDTTQRNGIYHCIENIPSQDVRQFLEVKVAGKGREFAERILINPK